MMVDPDEFERVVNKAMGLSTREDNVAESLSDAIDEAIAAMERVAEELHAAERLAAGTPLADAIGHFSAYHLADLEGKASGWLAGPHLIDALRAIRDGDW